MRKKIVTGVRLAYWLIPVLLLLLTLVFQACGDDGDQCGDTESLANAAACNDYGNAFNCSSIVFNDEANICTVNGCDICAFIVDDLDDF